MADYTNQTKHSTAFVNEPIIGIALWDDGDVAWDSPVFSWDASGTTQWTDRDKSRLTTRGFLPFFGWLFWGTVENDTITDVQWSDQIKH